MEKTPTKAKINLDGTSIEFSKVSEKIKWRKCWNRRKLIRISTLQPDKDYDAVNKKYVDEKLSDNNDKLDLVNEKYTYILHIKMEIKLS